MGDLLAPRWARPWVQLQGIVRKELLDVLRQPRLVAVLVVGPFVILVLFGIGYDPQRSELRTAFVGPEGAVYEQTVSTYEESLERYVQPLGYSTDIAGALARVEAGEIDLVVQFPPAAGDAVARGDQAIINVFHEKLDPIQQTSVEIAAKLAVLELNAEILERALTQASGGTVTPVEDGVVRVGEQVAEIREAVDDDDLPRARREAAELGRALTEIGQVADSSSRLRRQLAGGLSDGQEEDLDRLTTTTGEMERTAQRIASLPDGSLLVADRLTAELEEEQGVLTEQAEGVVTLDPAVLTRPFRTDAENLQREPIELAEYFAPNAIVLLLAHLALTITAMGLVRGEALGLFEVFRVGPMGTRNVLAGTYLSFLLLGTLVGTALVAAVVGLIGVPMRGSPLWLAAGLVLVLAASIGLGIVVALVARSDSQAVQLAMLVLLAGLFFGGFFLDTGLFRGPVRALATLLPVTPGISVLQDVMLRGDAPARLDLVNLVVTTLVYGALAAWLLWRRLRIRSGEAT